jgi:hypothetical protein
LEDKSFDQISLEKSETNALDKSVDELELKGTD